MTGAGFLALAVLFLASVLPSHAQSGGGGGGGGDGVRVVEVAEGAALELECGVVAHRGGGGWRAAGGGPLPGGLVAAERARPEGPVAVLRAARARPAHGGRYVCGADPHTVELRVTKREDGSEADGELAALSARGEEGAAELWYDVRGPITVACPLPGDVVWSINGTALEELGEAARRRWLTNGSALWVARSSEEDFGNYSCEAAGQRRAFFVRGRSKARLPDNTNVVEQQTVRLTCRLVGKPYPAVRWSYSNTSDHNHTLDVAAAFPDRVTLEDSAAGVAGAVLVLRDARRSDAGWLHCTPLVPGAAAATGALRVKDMYAALWPFLGICAEVLVLCAVILLYERRRSKPELDDSDTDNHDQKKS